MPDFDFEELGRLTELYANAGSTNPLHLLRKSAGLTPGDRALLELIVSKSAPEKVDAWKQALGATGAESITQPGGQLTKEEYANVARRDFEHSNKGSVLQFVLNEKKAKK